MRFVWYSMSWMACTARGHPIIPVPENVLLKSTGNTATGLLIVIVYGCCFHRILCIGTKQSYSSLFIQSSYKTPTIHFTTICTYWTTTNNNYLQGWFCKPYVFECVSSSIVLSNASHQTHYPLWCMVISVFVFCQFYSTNNTKYIHNLRLRILYPLVCVCII